ncbi:MAG TPA: hypothetical protein PLN52_18060, partial [Opitutaceae bacterium]|nr:hypothetical protein [Opitutaceae bacterium]
YYRAPHLYLSFAMRLVPDRQLLSSEEARTLGVFTDREKRISDGVFMTSRGGNRYDRTFMEAYFRPGPDRRMWVARNSMVAVGGVPLGDGRMGIYRHHHYASPTNHLVLYTEREDGLASLQAGAQEGQVVTKEVIVSGQQLWLNYSTSAVGYLRLEVLDQDQKPIPGYSLAESPSLFGDSLSRAVAWTGGSTWADLVGRAVRLRFVMSDANLYSLQQR